MLITSPTTGSNPPEGRLPSYRTLKDVAPPPSKLIWVIPVTCTWPPENTSVWLENPEGHRVKGWIARTDGIEPHHLAIAAVAGHWGNYMPIAKGKGTFFNDLVEMDLGHTDPLTFNQDICCKVKIYKYQAGDEA